MQNTWIERHIRRNTGWTVSDNDSFVNLSNEEYIGPGSEMPILRANYVELQAVWNVYAAECQLNERKGLWETTSTNMLTIWE